MTYYEDQLNKYKKQVEDKLAAQPNTVDLNANAQKDYFLNKQKENAKSVGDILSGLSNSYGISPDIGQAGSSQFGIDSNINNRKLNSQISLQRMSNLSDFYKKNYDYAVLKYQQAGYDLNQSDAFARAYAQQQLDQKFDADMAANSRNVELKKQKIADDYSARGVSIQDAAQQTQYEQALIRSLTGLATNAAYLGYQKYGRKQSGINPILQYNSAADQINVG